MASLFRITGGPLGTLFHFWPTRLAIAARRLLRRTPPDTTIRSILVVRLDGLGDCVMTLPLIEELHNHFAGSEITVLTQPISALVFEDSPFVARVLTLQPGPWRRPPKVLSHLSSALALYWRSLRGHRFDLVVNPRWDVDTFHATLLCALATAPRAIGYQDQTSSDKALLNPGFERLYTSTLPGGPPQHEILRNVTIARALGAPALPLRPHIPISEAVRAEARAWLESSGTRPVPAPETPAILLGLGLPAAHARRRWDAAHYIDTIRALETLDPGTSIAPVIFADSATRSMAEEIRAACPQSRIAFGLTLRQVAALIEACDVYIGADSGLMHVAAAVGARTVVLFVHPTGADPTHASSPDRIRPYGGTSLGVQPRAARSGCEAGCRAPDPHCILDLEPQEVARAVLTLLATRASSF